MRLRDASRTLYYDVKKKVADHQAPLKKEETTLPDDWEGGVAAEPRSNYLIYLAIATFFFFFITVGVAYFVRFAGIDRTVSTSKITILTQGPSVADSGLATPLTIRIANGNPVPIEDVALTIIYPDGTYKKTADDTVRLHRDEIVIGSMETGEVVSKNVTPILYGIDGQEKEIVYEVGYQAQGTSQPMRIEDSHSIKLRTTPILLTKPTHTSPVSGKEVTFQTKVQSNMKDIIDTVYVQVSYPSGFSPSSFSTTPFNAERTLWRLSSLRPNEGRDVWVRGVISGKERDEQAFVVGVFVSPTGQLSESVKVAEESVIFAIEKSFIDIDLALNGSRDRTIAVSPGGVVSGQLSWKNADKERLEDLIITVSLSGNGFDERSVTSPNGHLSESLRQIVWDKQQIRSYSLIRAGGQGEVEFSFNTLSQQSEALQAERNVIVSVSAKALRAQTRSVETIDHALQRQVSLRGSLQVVARTLYQDGSFSNQGPTPPQVGKRTSYTLAYDIQNSGNPIEDFFMKIPLNRGVTFAGQIAGIARDFWTYDEGFNEIAVRIPSFTAVGQRSSRSFEVQIIVDPDERDVGNVLILSQGTTWQARDAYINESVQGSVQPLSTEVLSEPLREAERGGVVAPSS
ncbi:MAG: hypothetical protein OYG31_02895 [Candidatus Kaiserbacteria bacterium]|nr:hypothetical protein [Candidatus Kaiserbacteria bacterium]